MSVAEHKPDGQRELKAVLWGFAWLSLVGALAGLCSGFTADDLSAFRAGECFFDFVLSSGECSS